MFECDGFEHRGDPSDSQGIALEYNCQDYGFLTNFSLLFCLTHFTFVKLFLSL